MRETRSKPEFKRPYCEVCKNIPRIRGRWTQLHCRDCKYPARSFSVYLVVRLMQHYTELEEKMLQLHKQHTTLYALYEDAIRVLVTKDEAPSPDVGGSQDDPSAQG